MLLRYGDLTTREKQRIHTYHHLFKTCHYDIIKSEYNLKIKSTRQCDWCKGACLNTKKKCSGCRIMYYCSRYCQKKDWSYIHRKYCYELANYK